MTTQTNTDHHRLAKVLEPLLDWDTITWQDIKREHVASLWAGLWADRCLSDPGAALALVEEHDWVMERDPTGENSLGYAVTLWIDGRYANASHEEFCGALVRAFVAAMEGRE